MSEGLTNQDFRKLLLTPRRPTTDSITTLSPHSSSSSSSSSSSYSRPSSSHGGPTHNPSGDFQEHKKKKPPPTAGKKKKEDADSTKPQEPQKGTIGYRDRAAERRQGLNPDYEEAQKELTAFYTLQSTSVDPLSSTSSLSALSADSLSPTDPPSPPSSSSSSFSSFASPPPNLRPSTLSSVTKTLGNATTITITPNPNSQPPIFTDAHQKKLIEDSKFLGGDMEHTHLVKGLDYALLAKVRSEIEQPDSSSKEQPAVSNENPDQVQVTTSIGKRIWSTLQRLEQQQQQQQQQQSIHTPAPLSLSLSSLSASSPSSSTSFVPPAINTPPIKMGGTNQKISTGTVGNSKDSKESKAQKRAKESVFKPGRSIFVFDLRERSSKGPTNNPNLIFEFPTLVVRSREDWKEEEERLIGGLDSELKEKIAKVLSYVRQGHGHSSSKMKNKKKRMIPINNHLSGADLNNDGTPKRKREASELSSSSKNENGNQNPKKTKVTTPIKPGVTIVDDDVDDIFPDVGEYVPSLERKAIPTPNNDQNQPQRDNSYFRSGRENLDDVGKVSKESEASTRELLKKISMSVRGPDPIPETSTAGSSTPASTGSKRGLDEREKDPSYIADEYSECYPGTYETGRVIHDEPDPKKFKSKKGKKNKKGGEKRFDKELEQINEILSNTGRSRVPVEGDSEDDYSD